MSNYIKISLPKMKKDEESLQADIEKIPQFIQDLNAAMKRLGSCWDGPAWVAFQGQVQEDVMEMTDLYEWLKRIIQSLSESEKIYGNSEKKSYQAVERIII